jgi:predicted nucleic acid-binding protein
VILVDTSSWLHFLRPEGDQSVRERVNQALRSGDACWCVMVRLELWNGAGGDRDKKVLRDFERFLPDLPIDAQVWQFSLDLAKKVRSAGVTVPATDLLIAACARRHQVGLEHADSDFKLLAKIV